MVRIYWDARSNSFNQHFKWSEYIEVIDESYVRVSTLNLNVYIIHIIKDVQYERDKLNETHWQIVRKIFITTVLNNIQIYKRTEIEVYIFNIIKLITQMQSAKPDFSYIFLRGYAIKRSKLLRPPFDILNNA